MVVRTNVPPLAWRASGGQRRGAERGPLSYERSNPVGLSYERGSPVGLEGGSGAELGARPVDGSKAPVSHTRTLH